MTSNIQKQKVEKTGNKNSRNLSRNNWSRNSPKPETENYKNGNGYTIPKVKYTYQSVPWEVFIDNTYDTYKTVRSSFIPYVMIDDERYWVLGSFHDYPKDILMDFGGSCIIFDPPKKYLKKNQRQLRHYQHQFGCAMLELNEESKGLLVKPVMSSLGNGDGVSVYRGSDKEKREYVWFVMVPLDYDEVKNVIGKFDDAPYVLKGEKLGPLDVYKESEMLNKTHRTSRNLTDFVNYLK